MSIIIMYMYQRMYLSSMDSYFLCTNILTAVLAEAYTESPMSIIIMYMYQRMYLSSMDSYFLRTIIISILQLR